MVTRILLEGKRAVGVEMLDGRTGELKTFQSKQSKYLRYALKIEFNYQCPRD